MLIRVMAPEGYGKTEYLFGEISRAISEKKRIFIITPEQSAAEYERETVERFGNGSNEYIEITNFSRLSNVVLRNWGELARSYLSKGGKRAAYALAVNEIKDNLSYIKRIPDPDNAARLISDIEELKSCGIDSKGAEKLSENEKLDAALRNKLSDIALISANFKLRSKDIFDDETDEGIFLAEVLSEYKFFENSEIFIDSFWDFTYPQRLIIEKMLEQSDKVFISFVCSREKRLIFTKGRNAAIDIYKRAERKGCEIKDIFPEKCFANPDIAYFAENLFDKNPSHKKTDAIRIYSCKNTVEEANFCANEITSLIHSGAKWNEISVLSRSGENDGIFSLIFKKHGIPHHFDKKEPLLASPAAKTIMLACKLACGDKSHEAAIKYLSQAYLSAPETDIFTLLKYVKLWRLSASELMRNTEFKYNPAGLEKLPESDMELKKELETVNKTKDIIFTPLIYLTMALEKGTLEEKVLSLIGFLKKTELEKIINEKTAAFKSCGDNAAAAREIRSWNLIISSLAELIRLAGKSEISKEDFPFILENALSGEDAGEVPPSQDYVNIGKVGFSRTRGIKYVFITGVSAGRFPQNPSVGGMISDKEKEKLFRLGYDIKSGVNERINEYFLFYLGAINAEKRLYISFSPDNESESVSPKSGMSVICQKFFLGFPDNKLRFFDSRTAFPQTKEEAFSYMLHGIRNEDASFEKLREYFSRQDEYRERMLGAESGIAFGMAEHKLEKELPYAKRDVNMSYSRIEKYGKCRYSYFANYLLDLEPEATSEIQNNTAGTFVHEVMEKALGKIYSEGRSIEDISDDELQFLNHSVIEDYTRAVPAFNESARMRYIVKNIEKNTFLLLKNLKAEFAVSAFRPVFFEKSLSDLCNDYKIPLDDGNFLRIFGSIDRVDYLDDGNFVRVVDYKTGKKDFELSKVFSGVGAQMLIYLFALTNGGFILEDKKIMPNPAGIVYLSGSRRIQNAKSAGKIEEVRKKALSPFNYNGLFLDDEKVLRAMDLSESGKYVSESKKKTNRINSDQFIILQKKLEKNLSMLASELKKGRIEPYPLKTDSTNTVCDYCSFRALCKHKNNNFRDIPKLSEEEMWEEEKNG